ncbi:MAG: helix-turn-helix transcriptional regulator [Clostridiaceae bacterium]|nr:helix-turn-helix transcriptional regulator [Clostridiaceae bacterium]
MDTQRIGKFLCELRKQNDMTQEQLGAKIGVTNKTVSRWETGNYMPPIESLKLLSDIYQLSINEILSGGRLSEENYKEAAEDNISITLEEMQAKDKSFEKNMLIIMAITSILAIVIMFLLPDRNSLSADEKIREILVIIFVLAMAVISNTVNIIAIVLKKNK